ncbi:MAG: glycosyl hydrolase family 18 protein [Clostridia bacterium]|jgi:spore peptidoglycan hydrolase
MAKRMKEKNERNSSKLIFNIFIVLVFLALLGGVFYLSPNYIREDYDGKTKVLINNNNVTLKMKNDVYIDENNNVFLSLADVRNYFDKYIEYDKENGSIVTTSEINIAKMSTKDNKITINGQEEELNSSAIEKNETIYLPFSEISEKVYDVDLEYIKDTNTIIIDSLDRKQEVANTTKETKLKYKPQTLSGTLEKLEANEQVVYIEETNNWAEVRSKDGTIGYVKKEDLGNVEVTREAKEYIDKVEGKVNLVWDYYSEYAKAPDRTGETMDGVNVVSPSFFSLERGSNGEIYDNAKDDGAEYIEWAHNNNYQVWAMFSNNSLKDTTSQILNDYEKREAMIENLMDLVEEYNLDGVNVDFENMNESDKDVYSRFLIELAPRLKKIGKTLSVDVTAPDGSETWSLCFDRNTIANVADYIVFMAYDQYGTSSNKAGTTAGYNWVEANIKKFLGQEDVDPEKIILGIPLYMRLWEEEEDGTAKPEVVNMRDMFDVLPENQVATWDEELKQYYVEYEEDGKKYKMWVENEKSVGEKINLANQYNLAGIAFWEKDRETNDEFWTFVKEQLNK